MIGMAGSGSRPRREMIPRVTGAESDSWVGDFGNHPNRRAEILLVSQASRVADCKQPAA